MSPPPSSFLRDARLLSSSSSSSTATFLAESQTTEYDGYQQAWRLLGYFVDCQSASAQEENGNNNNNNENNNNNDDGEASCQRYLLWAAYIDPNYQGLGVSEYQYYDATRHAYDPTACQAIAADNDSSSSSYFWNNNNNCPKKMDCHESHTDFQLLGVFKEPYYASAWVPTLLQHQCGALKQQQDDDEQEGDNNNEYTASAAYQALTSQQWPEACTATGKYIPVDGDDNGETVQLYVHLQASVTAQLALYVDSHCQTEYVPTDNAVSQDKLAADLGLATAAQAAQWNEALRPYYYCQPCKAHDLSNNRRRRQRSLEENNNAADTDFACYDAAGEVNANQCAAFAQNSGLQAASWRDLSAAIEQGSLAQITIPGNGGTTYGLPLSQLETAIGQSGNRYASASAAASSQQWPAYLGLVLSGLFCLATATFGLLTVNWKLEKRQQRLEERRRVLAEPLVTTASF